MTHFGSRDHTTRNCSSGPGKDESILSKHRRVDASKLIFFFSRHLKRVDEEQARDNFSRSQSLIRSVQKSPGLLSAGATTAGGNRNRHKGNTGAKLERKAEKGGKRDSAIFLQADSYSYLAESGKAALLGHRKR